MKTKLLLIFILCFAIPALATENVTCADSDNGISEYVYGWAEVSGGKYYDICEGSSVKEWYCDGSTKLYTSVSCANGCVDGVCKKSTGNDPTTGVVCIDSDSGKDYYTYGNVVHSTGTLTHFDYCENSTKLKELYCDNGYYAYEYYICPGGCSSGKCIPETTTTTSTTTTTIPSSCLVNLAEKDLSLFVLASIDLDSSYNPGQYTTSIDPGVNYNFAEAIQSGYQLIYVNNADTLIFRLNKYNTSSYAEQIYDIINTQHTRVVLFNNNMIGKETFCHESPDYYLTNGKYYYICGFWYDKIYVDVQWTTSYASYSTATENLEKIYKKILAVCGISSTTITTTTLPSTCTDSDGGIEKYIYGKTSYGDHTVYDSCKDTKYLTEWYCSNGVKTSTVIECPVCCQEGVCKDSCETSTCTDSDSGINEYVYGKTSYGDHTVYDYCKDSSYLVEWYCSNGVKTSTVIACPYGCKEGVCLEASSCLCSEADLNKDGIIDYKDLAICGSQINNTYCQKCIQYWYGKSCVTKTCKDSDNGKDYYTMGSTCIVSSAETTDSANLCVVDYCYSDYKLKEYYCSGDSKYDILYECPYGCKEGACLKETCPVYIEPLCQNGYLVSGPVDPVTGCKKSSTCCGDFICSGSENYENCNNDCKESGAYCGNGKCEIGEDSGNCAKDCGITCPQTKKCNNGRIVNCFKKYDSCECESCNMPIECESVVDESGFTHILCKATACLVIDTYQKEKCISYGGTPVLKKDYAGCEFVDCQFANETSVIPRTVPIECPSPAEIEETLKKCEYMGMKPLVTIDGNCKIVKCISTETTVCREITPEMKAEIETKCKNEGMILIRDFDVNGCGVLKCGAIEECKEEPPAEVYEKCKGLGGEFIVKRDTYGCIVFARCIMPGDEKDIYFEYIEEVPETNKLMAVILKLEELRVEFDKLARKADSIADYYASVGSDEENRFRRVADMFETAKNKIDEIRNRLRNRLGQLTTDDLMEIKYYIRYIKDVMMKDILYVMLSSSDDVKDMESQDDCGSDLDCFERALRVCKTVRAKPSGGPIIVSILGLENDICLIKAELEDGVLTQAAPLSGINPPYTMTCRIQKYSMGIGNAETDLLPYCEGSLIELIKKFSQTSTQTEVTSTATAETCAGCLNNGVCDPGECSDCNDCRGV